MKTKIVLTILKYLVVAAAGALGMTVVQGCTAIPFFVF